MNTNANSSLPKEKQRLRAQINKTLAQLHYDRRQIAKNVLENLLLLDKFQKGATFGVFIDFRNEIPTSLFLPELYRRRKGDATFSIAAPYCLDSDMIFYRIPTPVENADGTTRLPGLERSRYGVLEPNAQTRADGGALVQPPEFDVMIVPGLAFDHTGARLGRGAGFYDRYLPLLRPDALRVAVAFDEQILPEVPHDANDQFVDAIVTPSRIIRANRPV